MAGTSKKARWMPGQFVRIDLGDGSYTLARVLTFPLVAFHGQRYPSAIAPDIDEVGRTPVIFTLLVMRHAITSGRWPVIGRRPLSPDLLAPPPFFKQDLISGKLSIYQEVPELAPLYERPATLLEVQGLECCAVWEPEHVEDRLRDHFAGRPCVWVERFKLKPPVH